MKTYSQFRKKLKKIGPNVNNNANNIIKDTTFYQGILTIINAILCLFVMDVHRKKENLRTLSKLILKQRVF